MSLVGKTASKSLDYTFLNNFNILNKPSSSFEIHLLAVVGAVGVGETQSLHAGTILLAPQETDQYYK